MFLLFDLPEYQNCFQLQWSFQLTADLFTYLSHETLVYFLTKQRSIFAFFIFTVIIFEVEESSCHIWKKIKLSILFCILWKYKDETDAY